ncbi:LysR family transcriptional regulator [Microvirga puerhi]|uniref:LysR family transcriptional regulator n=1 Tax=Microvirga puerhi TaxID=2876078 RepID=A0ABS7VT34_9HYPH|nr:LysR family transcriptional regulator [Microvirga puerhi]MBZ6078711.1 LysR family transcriptional regulator [Microvirga puerhi]
MELKWLEDFLSLARSSNFSRSASERNITQSALSRRIKQLETWLGVALVDRTTYPVRLTPEGDEVLPRIQEAVALLQGMRRDIREMRSQTADVLTFATLNTLSLTFFPGWIASLESAGDPILTRFSDPYPSFLGNISTLMNGGCDFLLTYAHESVSLINELSRFSYIAVGTEQVVPVTAPNALGAPLHAVGKGHRPAHYLSYGNCSFFAHLLADMFAKRPIPLMTVYENGLSMALKAMALSGRGVAWIPESLVRAELASGDLLRAGDPSLDLLVEIRVYRAHKLRRQADQFWQRALDSQKHHPKAAVERGVCTSGAS